MVACTNTHTQSTQCSIKHPICNVNTHMRVLSFSEQPGNPCGADFGPTLGEWSVSLVCWFDDQLVTMKMLSWTGTSKKWGCKGLGGRIGPSIGGEAATPQPFSCWACTRRDDGSGGGAERETGQEV